MLKDFLQINFGTLMIIIFMLIFIKTNRLFAKKDENLFLTGMLILSALVVVDNIELWTASFSHPTKLRICMSAIGYTLRPLIVLNFLVIVLRGAVKKYFIIVVPAIINAIVAVSAFFTDIAYSYDEANQFVRGPLGLITHITGMLYLFILLCCSVRFFLERNVYEGLIIVAIVVICLLATTLESTLKLKGLLRMAAGLSIVFYYLYFHTQSFKRDMMTGCLRRRFMYLDAVRRQVQLRAVVSIDLNNLKTINDTQGHAEGDKAICTMVECVRRIAPRNCILYRTGGDEFMMLCFKQEMDTVKQMVEAIKREMAQTPYSCAIGMTEYRRGEDIDIACNRVDKIMYEDKLKMKEATVK